ncbi:PGF-pre-PGF domain-containing protein [Candidatus Woesearchaeota archaeon]|nr:PGF-pre-PGF domain-containing protein [Candidatus Woesearchaeota archaeon]
MQRTTIIFLLIALLLPSASAEFLAFGDTTINLEPCTATARNITIQNSGQEQAAYSISVDGAGSDYVTFSNINFGLLPGQYTTINTYYNIPCAAKPGSYPLSVYFTDGEIELELPQEIIVSIPDNINLTSTQTSAVIPPCETATYTISLSNPSNFTEIYTITATGHSDVHVSEKQAVLKPKEQKNIIISVTPEDCTESGIYALTVRFETEKSEQQKEQTLELIIKSTDVPRIAEGTSRIRTDYVDSTAELTIQNTGDRITQYTLGVQGINWATITPETVILNPGQTKTIALRLAPTPETAKGSYPILLTATVEETGIKYSKELIIKLQPPTLLERNPVLLVAIAAIVLAALIFLYIIIRYVRSPHFKESYRKWKERRKQLREKLEAIRKAREQKRAEQLKKKQEQQKKELERKQAEKERIKKQLQREVDKEYKKQYHIVARKDLIIGRAKRNTGKIIAIIFGILLLILIGLFWQVIAPNLEYVAIGIIILVVIYIAKKLSRLTVIKAKWKTLIDKQTTTIKTWKKGISQLGITAKKPINNFKLLIKKTKARISPTPAVYQTILIKTNAPDDAISLKATFTIPKSWIKRKLATPDDVKLGRFTNSWTTVPLKKTGEDKYNVHYAAEIKPGTYSIYVKPGKKKPISKKTKIIIGIIAIALIAGIAVILSPQPATIAYGIPSQTWQQNTVHRLDLGRYFTDPDKDSLTYTATEAKHITIEITGNTAYLTPETDWTGEERVRFIANDGKGGQAASNTISLKVQKQVIPQKYQPYIAIILSIITILVLIWIVATQKR